MTPDDVYRFLTENRIGYLATRDGDTVAVRAMRIFRANEHGIIIKCIRTKAVYRQLCAQPEAELCVFDEAGFRQLRLHGRFLEIEDRNLRQEIANNAPHYKRDIETHGLEVLRIFVLRNGIAKLWAGDPIAEIPLGV